jgi:hypothetical protein
VAATGPATALTYEPDHEAGPVYDRVYAVYRSLYETLGRAQADLLRGLKRIRVDRAAQSAQKGEPGE